MADIVLTAVINKAFDIASQLILEGNSQLNWLEEDINWIEREMRHIQSYLDEAEARRAESHGVENLIKDIDDLAHDIEDILDTLLPWMESHRKKGYFTCLSSASFNYFSCYGNNTARSFAQKIEKIRRRVMDIDRIRSTYGIMDRGGSAVGETWNPRRSFLYADGSEIVGLDQDTKKLENKLLNSDLENGVISIVGMPGVGKTTLGKEIYRRVEYKFECSAVIYVSQEPRVRDLLLDIAKQVGLEKEKWEENLEINLLAFLKEKRFLILLDDIWHTRTWDAMKFSIPNNPITGSRIIITSRNIGVGRYIGGEGSLHQLQPLNQENSWKLFVKMIMINGSATIDPLEVESIGRKIVEKCGGLPLAIVVTAGMLRERESTEHAWSGVLKSMGRGEQDECSKMLAMSYKDLPSRLKPCFLYFGLFPEDHEIPALQLINMWAAEKFVVARGNQEVEDVAEDYLNNLVSRNLIQVASRRFDGSIRSCRIHDLLHNLCISVAEESNFFFTIDNLSSNSSSSRGRRMAYYRSNISEDVARNYEMPKSRAFLLFDTNQNHQKDRSTVTLQLGGSKFLRVLLVESNSFLSSLPDAVGTLSLLSYLRLSGFYHGNLPSSIRKLTNLQTLDLRQCKGISIPTCVWTMKQLKFFLLPESATFTSTPTRRGLMSKESFNSQHPEVSLPSLQILDVVNCRYLDPLWLQNFTKLRKLGVRYPSQRISEVLSDAKPISQKLENLRLTGSYFMGGKLDLSLYDNLLKLHLGIVIEKLPDVDEFPPNLTKLTLRFTGLEEDPFETLKKLPKLEILKLGYRSYTGRKMVCSGADGFPRLRMLKVEELYDLEELLAEDEAMPLLKLFTMRDCWKLKVSKSLLSKTMVER